MSTWRQKQSAELATAKLRTGREAYVDYTKRAHTSKLSSKCNLSLECRHTVRYKSHPYVPSNHRGASSTNQPIGPSVLLRQCYTSTNQATSQKATPGHYGFPARSITSMKGKPFNPVSVTLTWNGNKLPMARIRFDNAGVAHCTAHTSRCSSDISP